MRKNEAMIPTNYAAAAAYLRLHGTERTRLGISHNNGHLAVVRVNEAAVAVRLYAADIVTFHADGSIRLDTGGYRTATTKAKMNAALRHTIYHIVQRGGVWWLAGSTDKREWTPFTTRSLTIPATPTPAFGSIA